MKLSDEAKVGLLITASFTIFIVLVGVLAKINVSQSGYVLKLYFGFLNDLREGSPVKIAGGIKIGQVESISQSGEKTEVSIWIDNKYKLIRSTQFAIFTTGLIGEKYINVFVPPSSDVSNFLKNGDTLYGIDPASFDQMMLTFQGFLHDKHGGQMLAEIFQNSHKFVENLNNLVDENRYDIKKSVLITKAMMGTLSMETREFMKQLNILTTNLSQLSEKNKEDIAIALRNLSEISDHLNKIMYRLDTGRGTMGKLLADEEIYNNLKDASVSAKDLFYSLKKDPSKLLFSPKK
ncbi:MAG: MCE family protein [Spirochaetes bacterium]|nr:MCE family protein [Spirochaetota bacterium]